MHSSFLFWLHVFCQVSRPYFLQTLWWWWPRQGWLQGGIGTRAMSRGVLSHSSLTSHHLVFPKVEWSLSAFECEHGQFLVLHTCGGVVASDDLDLPKDASKSVEHLISIHFLRCLCGSQTCNFLGINHGHSATPPQKKINQGSGCLSVRLSTFGNNCF